MNFKSNKPFYTYLIDGALSIICLLVFIMLISTYGSAAELSASIGKDVAHSNAGAVTAHYRAGENELFLGALVDVEAGERGGERFAGGAVGFVGYERNVCSGAVRCGLGAAYLTKRAIPTSGTKANFSLSASVPTSFGRVGVRHFSHGTKLGIEEGRANNGWNVVFVEYNFSGGR